MDEPSRVGWRTVLGSWRPVRGVPDRVARCPFARGQRLAAAGVALLLLGGCAAMLPPQAAAPPPLPPPPEPVIVHVPTEVIVKVPEVSPADSAARGFFAYFERVRQMPPGELSREFSRLDPPNHPAAVLEMALALGHTRNPNDMVRALGLLDPLLKSTDPAAAPWQPLARLLAVRYAEQRRIEEHIERQNQQLRDSQRRLEQLTQQLEALKAIERSLTTRPVAPATGPPSRVPPP